MCFQKEQTFNVTKMTEGVTLSMQQVSQMSWDCLHEGIKLLVIPMEMEVVFKVATHSLLTLPNAVHTLKMSQHDLPGFTGL